MNDIPCVLIELPVYKPLAWLLDDSTAELPLVLLLSSVYSSLHNNGVHDLGVQRMPTTTNAAQWTYHISRCAGC